MTSQRLNFIFFLFPLCIYLSVAQADSEPTIRAGFEATELNLPLGTPLAGYFQRQTWPHTKTPLSYFFQPSEGTADPIRAKALVLEVQGQKVALVSVDLVAAYPNLNPRVFTQVLDLGIPEEQIHIIASHTHSGPGGFVKTIFWEFLAADLFVREIFDTVVSAITKVLRRANSQMQPATVNLSQFHLEGFTRNRRQGNNPTTEKLGLWTFNNYRQERLGQLIHFPVHGDLLSPENLLLSSDVPGSIERRTEEHFGGVSLFLPGPSGDIDPISEARDLAGLNQYSQRWIKKVREELTHSRLQNIPGIKFYQSRMNLELPKPRLNLRNCVKFLIGWDLPFIPSRLPLPKYLRGPAPINAMVIDNHLLLTLPGEPTRELGLAINDFGLKKGFSSVSIVGLTSSYFGYILKQEDYELGGYEACNSFYGNSYGEIMVEGVKKLISSLK